MEICRYSCTLKQYSDEAMASDTGENDEYESGKVNVWREKAKDEDSHGTTVILTNIKPQSRDTLRSAEMWASISQSDQSQDEFKLIDPPKYYIGQVDSKGELLVARNATYSNLPWNASDSPDVAFQKTCAICMGLLVNRKAEPQT